jgi:hypothetical protein
MLDALLNDLNPDGSDEEDDPAPLTEFMLAAAEGTTKPEDCSSVIVCGPGAAGTFIKTMVPALKPVTWRFTVSKEPERRFPPPPKPPAFFTSSSSSGKSVAVAILERDIPVDLAYAWVSALRKGFPKSSEIVMLDMITVGEWKTIGEQERPQEPNLFGLWTSAWVSSGEKGSSPCPGISALPSPNFLGGVAAALLSQCEAEQKRGLVALALQDGAHVMASSLVGFEGLRPLLVELGLECAKSPDFVEALRHVAAPNSRSIYA